MEKTMMQRLLEAHEPYAAGLFEFPERSRLYRYSNALLRDWEYATLVPYDGGALYPCGRSTCSCDPDSVVRPHFSYSFFVHDEKRLREKVDAECADAVMEEFLLAAPFFDTPHTVGGSG